MESLVRRKSESESGGERYTRNIQRIFNNESNFRFRQLESCDEDKELLTSPAESEHDDLLGLGNIAVLVPSGQKREELAGVQGPADREEEEEEEEEEKLININNNVHLPQLSKSEPPPLTLQPLPRSITMKYTGIASSPYKEAAKSGPKSVSPDSSDYCPNNWFELKAEEEQEGFVAQLCWKWCFLCVCLPLCYPCYLTRTLRKKLKAGERQRTRGDREGCLVTAGQQEMTTATLSSKHSVPGSSQHHQQQHTQSEAEIVNVVFMQSASARSLIKVLQERGILQSDLKDPPPVDEQERVSPVILRRRTAEHQTSGTSGTSGVSQTVHHKGADGDHGGVQAGGHVTGRKTRNRNSDVFYSLESNLDQKFPMRPPLTTAISEVQSNIMSSLPSMTSGRVYYSANSSIFSGVSSPRSDLSPTVPHSKDDCVDHIEPIVEILDHQDSSDSVFQVKSLDRKTPGERDRTKPSTLDHVEKKSTVTTLDSSKSFRPGSLTRSTTKVCQSSEELSVDSKPAESVKFEEKPARKYSTLPAPPRQKLPSYKQSKLGLKYLGKNKTEERPNCPGIEQHFYEEGELSSWSPKDIYDIVSRDLPRMDILVMVVNQEEKKMIDKTLGQLPGGVVGYIKEYWSGFFPLLLIEVAHKNGETELIEAKCSLAIHSLFSVTHRIIVTNFESNIDFVLESVARFYNHIKVFQCEKFQQTLHTDKLGHLVSLSLTEKYWFCSGLCQMRVSKKKDETEAIKAGLGLFKTVRRTIKSKIED